MDSESLPRSIHRAGAGFVLALLLALVAAPGLGRAACPTPGGVGGTGLSDPGDGVGGTGIDSENGPTGGVGGTGIDAARQIGSDGVGGTGIVGVISGFGSICVNGLEVEYDEATPIDVDGEPGTSAALAVGQVVAIVAEPGSGGLHARHVAIHAALRGPVSAIDSARGELIVLGQRVFVGPDAVFRDLTGEVVPGLQNLGADAFVSVHGLRGQGGTLMATRVEQVTPSDRVSVSGAVSRGPSGQVAVAGVALSVASRPGQKPSSGAGALQGLALGHWNPTTGSIEAATVVSSFPASLPVSRVSVAGYVLERHGDELRTDLARIDVSASSAASDAVLGDRVIVTGRISSDGAVRAERVRIELRREHPTSREGSEERSARDHDADDDDSDRGDGDGVADHDSQEHASGDRVSGTERGESVERPDSSDGHDSPERPEAPEHPESVEAPERPESAERPESVEKPEQVEKPEAPERPEQIEKPEAPERPEQIEKPEAPERPERIERPEAPEKPEKPEDIEKPETPDLPDD